MKFGLKISALLLAFTVITSSIGISLYQHKCNISNTTRYSLFEASGFSCALNHVADNGGAIKNHGCCKNFFFFFKVHLITVQNFTTSVILPLLSADMPFQISTLCKSLNKIHGSGFMNHTPPLLFPGALFIYHLHAIKIPAPVL